jgi:hypothetical protein
MDKPHVTRATSHIIRACTSKRIFFAFDPDEEADTIGSAEPFEVYAARICEKFGFVALDTTTTQSVTYWSE